MKLPYKWLLPLSLLLSPLAQSQQVDVQDIVKRAELAAYYAGDDGRSAARMLITDAQGRKQMRQFVILRKDREDGGSQDMMVFFSRPADVRDTVFRVVKNTDRDDDRWLYLPGWIWLNVFPPGINAPHSWVHIFSMKMSPGAAHHRMISPCAKKPIHIMCSTPAQKSRAQLSLPAIR